VAVERLEWGCELFRCILNDKQADKVDLSHIASVSAVEMQVSKEYKDDVLGYFTSTMVPYMMESPDIHRFRLFEVDNATVFEGSKQETANKEDLRPYFCLVEFATEDYPWDVILEMADTDEWKRWVGDPKMMVCFDCVHCGEYANEGRHGWSAITWSTNYTRNSTAKASFRIPPTTRMRPRARTSLGGYHSCCMHPTASDKELQCPILVRVDT
jgi:hypothetical protein